MPKQANLATYRINSATTKTLDDFVDVIEANPGDLISPNEFNDCGSAMDLKAAAQAAGMVTLKDAGTLLARQGITTPQEVSRVIEAIDEEVV